MRIGIDAHKRNCTTCVFEEDGAGLSPKETFAFETTRQGVQEFMGRVPEKAIVVIESSTTGKVLSRMLSERYEVHMIAPPERKAQIKTDKRDAARMIREDALGYARRCYVPSQYVEDMRFVVAKQVELGEKISRVKNQVHALLERNMVQCEFEAFSDAFGVGGLERMSSLDLPKQDAITLAMYLEELRLYASQHGQLEQEIAKIAESDPDCQLLLSHPGISSFTSVAIKSRIGDDASRFPTKKHLCSYAGVVPGADNTGERTSEHGHVKRGDAVLKYALTCAVRGAVKAKANSAVKRFYMKQMKRGVAPQKAEVAAARKLACIVWKMLTSKRRYVEEDAYLTGRKARGIAAKARRGDVPNAAKPGDVAALAKSLMSNADVLERYPEDMDGMLRHRSSRRSGMRNTSKDEGAKKS